MRRVVSITKRSDRIAPMKTLSFWVGIFLLLGENFSFSATEPLPIPRIKANKFLSEGIFTGGSFKSANLERIRFSPHKKEGYERWVFDFSDAASRKNESLAPRFLLRYIKASKIEPGDGTPTTVIPAKFILSLQSVRQNYLEQTKIKRLLRKSAFVKDIIVYPPIEEGDLALEIVLKDSVAFEAHQPKLQEGRLVLDIKNAPL